MYPGASIYPLSRITLTSQISGADLLALYTQQNGGDCALSLTLLAAWLEENLTITQSDAMVTQYAAPSATGFSVTIGASAGISDGESVWLILTPVAGYAAGTIVLPAAADAVDKQEVLVNCTQAVTTLTMTSSGASVTGGPTTLAANAFFRLRFDAVMTTWYRVG